MAKTGVFRHRGYCDICEKEVEFSARYSWFRDHLLCPSCQSVPRERALMWVLKRLFPAFRHLRIHESSPGGRGVSAQLARDCPHYSVSHYFPGTPPGAIDPAFGARCETLEALTFPSGSFDLLITQDVMEHVLSPEAAFREIGRVLRPGGAHVFTAPLVRKKQPSRARAARGANGCLIHFHEPEYHGSPTDEKGALVTMDWGYDIVSMIENAAGMRAEIISIEDINRGIQAEFIDVIVSFKD